MLLPGMEISRRHNDAMRGSHKDAPDSQSDLQFRTRFQWQIRNGGGEFATYGFVPACTFSSRNLRQDSASVWKRALLSPDHFKWSFRRSGARATAVLSATSSLQGRGQRKSSNISN